MELEAFFDERTSTLTYVVWDAETRDAVVIDPVMDYEPAGSTTWTESVEKVIAFLQLTGGVLLLVATWTTSFTSMAVVMLVYCLLYAPTLALTNSVIGDAVDSKYPVPHNIALTQSPGKLYLTHSGGTSDKVTFYDVSYSEPIPVFAGEVTVGLNPFGLAYVP